MSNWTVNEVFESRLEAIEFYKKLYSQISKFRTLSFELTLKWGNPYSVEGWATIKDEAYKAELSNIFENLD